MRAVFELFRPFIAPIAMILVVSGILLAFDDSRSRSSASMPRVAIVQHTTQAAIDEGVKGIIEGLASKGRIDGRTVRLSMFNAQGDLATANDIGRRVTDGSNDLVISASTLSLQTVANANRQSKVPHVYGIIVKSQRSGVGIGADPMDHPPWMVGYDSLINVPDVLKMALEFNPGLRRLGLIWHSSEVSSQIYTEEIRKTCKSLGIELLEANAENSTEVAQAAQSLTSRGVDAFLVSADVVTLVAIDVIVKAARNARIPVISIIPPNVRKGTLFDLGLDYVSIGRDVGELAASVLDGTSPASLPITNRAPGRLMINLNALEGLRDPWRIPQAARDRATVIIDKDGEHGPGAIKAAAGSASSPAPASR